MKALSIFLMLSLIFLDIKSSTADIKKWESFKIKFNRVDKYANQKKKESERYSIFSRRLDDIESHNKNYANGNKTFRMNMNTFGDQTDEEIRQTLLPNNLLTFDIRRNRYKPIKPRTTTFSSTTQSQNSNVNKNTTSNPNAVFVDWKAAGYVSPVKNQGNCGSCYTFSSVAAIESAYAIKNKISGNQVDFSEQQLVDCSISYGNAGCNGGSIYNTLLYVKNNGLMQESDYQYASGTNGLVQICSFNSNKVSARLAGFNQLDYSNTNQIIEALKLNPVIAHLYVANDFYFYSSGIYTSDSCQSQVSNYCQGVNHAVLLTGYGVENNVKYYIAKNSWGTTWGEDGYFKIKAGDNTCCIEAFEYTVQV